MRRSISPLRLAVPGERRLQPRAETSRAPGRSTGSSQSTSDNSGERGIREDEIDWLLHSRRRRDVTPGQESPLAWRQPSTTPRPPQIGDTTGGKCNGAPARAPTAAPFAGCAVTRQEPRPRGHQRETWMHRPNRAEPRQNRRRSGAPSHLEAHTTRRRLDPSAAVSRPQTSNFGEQGPSQCCEDSLMFQPSHREVRATDAPDHRRPHAARRLFRASEPEDTSKAYQKCSGVGDGGSEAMTRSSGDCCPKPSRGKARSGRRTLKCLRHFIFRKRSSSESRAALQPDRPSRNDPLPPTPGAPSSEGGFDEMESSQRRRHRSEPNILQHPLDPPSIRAGARQRDSAKSPSRTPACHQRTESLTHILPWSRNPSVQSEQIRKGSVVSEKHFREDQLAFHEQQQRFPMVPVPCSTGQYENEPECSPSEVIRGWTIPQLHSIPRHLEGRQTSAVTSPARSRASGLGGGEDCLSPPSSDGSTESAVRARAEMMFKGPRDGQSRRNHRLRHVHANNTLRRAGSLPLHNKVVGGCTQSTPRDRDSSARFRNLCDVTSLENVAMPAAAGRHCAVEPRTVHHASGSWGNSSLKWTGERCSCHSLTHTSFMQQQPSSTFTDPCVSHESVRDPKEREFVTGLERYNSDSDLKGPQQQWRDAGITRRTASDVNLTCHANANAVGVMNQLLTFSRTFDKMDGLGEVKSQSRENLYSLLGQDQRRLFSQSLELESHIKYLTVV